VGRLSDRPGRFSLNITVEDGFGGNDTQLVSIRVRDKTSTAINDLCATWLVIVVAAAAAIAGAEWYRRRYLRETGPVIGPGGEFTEEEAFGGVVTAKLGGARLAGGTGQEAGARYSPPEARPRTRAELAAEARKKAEESIALPEKAVSADRDEERRAGEAAALARKGQSLLPLVEGATAGKPPAPEKAGPPESKDPLEELLKK
jgi:hypothetical protein